MNVLYLISTFEKGVGGHYYSLISTVDQLHPTVNPIILNIGISESPIIRQSPYTNYFAQHNGFNTYNILSIINKLIYDHNIDLIHCFDDRSYYFTRFWKVKKKPIVVTKCGGPNPKYYPFCDNLILFSKEDEEYFQKKNIYPKISLIPNRVNRFDSSFIRIKELSEHLNLDDNEIIFLRITRIAKFYLQSIKQSINLVHDLYKKGKKVKLIIIGDVVDEEIVNAHLADKDYIKYTSNPRFTQNAKELIDISDFYIGTGRGLMEATQKNQVILTPLKDKKYPGLVNEKTFSIYFQTNFSERNISSSSNQDLFNEVLSLIENNEDKQRLLSFYKKMFTQFFDISMVKDKYLSIYKNAKVNSGNIFSMDFIIHSIFYHYYFITHKYPRLRRFLTKLNI